MTPLSRKEFENFFTVDRLVSDARLDAFCCAIAEYNAYLTKESLKSQNDMIAVTYLLHEKRNGNIAAYMSLIADAIKLSASERELHQLNYPFKTMPAMKIAKLAVSAEYKTRFSGIGSKMIDIAAGIATTTYKDRFACRFITVDADIEHDRELTVFYSKNGFIANTEMNNQRSKTINMRKDLYIKY
jgi:predicted GNAT family N-acyltransferase